MLKANYGMHELIQKNAQLSKTTTSLADGCEAISIFNRDKANARVLEALHKTGVKYIALRSAEFNHVDLAKKFNLKVARVPAHSLYAIAEQTVTMVLALNRMLIRVNRRIMEMDFSLDCLVGFDVNGKTAGIIGTGKIGTVLSRILHGFGSRILAYYKEENKELTERFQVEYASCESLCEHSDIITLHIPLNENTRYNH